MYKTFFAFLLFAIIANNQVVVSIEPDMLEILQNINAKLYEGNEKIPFDSIPQLHNDKFFFTAFDEIAQMLDGRRNINLKRAIFLVEWAYLKGRLDYADYCSQIDIIVSKLNSFIDKNKIRGYKTCTNAALFEFFTKTNDLNDSIPFSYDPIDPGGRKDIQKTFVTKLLKTHTGQCSSFHLLYKILCNELGGTAYLTHAPNHLFITHPNELGEIINIELTTGTFHNTEIYIETLGISKRAIKNGVFLRGWNEKEDIAYALNLLAEVYFFKYKAYDTFTFICSQKILRFVPNFCLALSMQECTLNQWGYDYVQIHGKKTSSYINIIDSEHKRLIKLMEDLGFSSLTAQEYINNVDNLYKRSGKEPSESWLKFKKYNNQVE